MELVGAFERVHLELVGAFERVHLELIGAFERVHFLKLEGSSEFTSCSWSVRASSLKGEFFA